MPARSTRRRRRGRLPPGAAASPGGAFLARLLVLPVRVVVAVPAAADGPLLASRRVGDEEAASLAEHVARAAELVEPRQPVDGLRLDVGDGHPHTGEVPLDGDEDRAGRLLAGVEPHDLPGADGVLPAGHVGGAEAEAAEDGAGLAAHGAAQGGAPAGQLVAVGLAAVVHDEALAV